MADENSVTAIDQSQMAPAAAPTEKMVPQSQVDHVAGRARSEGESRGYEKALREFEARKAAEAQPQQQPQMQQGQQPLTLNDLNHHLEKVRQEGVAKELENQFLKKIDTAKSQDPDYDKKVTPLVKDMYERPNDWGMTAHLVNSMDNSADILKDLADNPSKVTDFLTWTKAAPNLAYQKMQELSASIKQNKSAVSNEQSVNEPIRRIKPSPNVGTDNGVKTIRDWRSNPKLRG